MWYSCFCGLTTVTRKCSCKKVFWKYAVNLLENARGFATLSKSRSSTGVLLSPSLFFSSKVGREEFCSLIYVWVGRGTWYCEVSGGFGNEKYSCLEDMSYRIFKACNSSLKRFLVWIEGNVRLFGDLVCMLTIAGFWSWS